MDAVRLLVVGLACQCLKTPSGSCPLQLWLTVLAEVLLLDVGAKLVSQTCRLAGKAVSPMLRLVNIVEWVWHFIGVYLLFHSTRSCPVGLLTCSYFAVSTFFLSCFTLLLRQFASFI